MSNFWLAEILLVLAALLVASQYWHIARSRFQSPALLIVAALLCLALAAAAGAYRYGIDPGITPLHRALSRLSGYISFLLIGLSLLWVKLRLPFGFASRAPAYAILVMVVAAALSLGESGQFRAERVSTLLSSIGLLIWLLVAVWEMVARRYLQTWQALLLAVGSVVIVFAGLFIGTDATRIFGIARINWFHLLLALAVLSLLGARPLFNQQAKEIGRVA